MKRRQKCLLGVRLLVKPATHDPGASRRQQRSFNNYTQLLFTKYW